MPKIRSFLLSFSEKIQIILIILITVAVAYVVSMAIRSLFDVHQLKTDNNLIVAVYTVIGTIYAVLLAFVVSGSWQNFSSAARSVQAEAAALSDLVHIMNAFPGTAARNFRRLAIAYAQSVIATEWHALAALSRGIKSLEDFNLDSMQNLIEAVRSIEPASSRESIMFGQAVVMLNSWLDARRTRLLSAAGGKVGALWPLLIFGAVVLFAFHGLFVADTKAIGITLLLGISLLVGLSFALILSLDSPFSGDIAASNAPFQWLIHWCQDQDSGPILP